MLATAGRTWLRGHPVDAGDHAASSSPEPLQSSTRTGDERHLLGDAVGRAADRAGDVRAVAVAVVRALAVADRVEAVADAAAELGVAWCGCRCR